MGNTLAREVEFQSVSFSELLIDLVVVANFAVLAKALKSSIGTKAFGWKCEIFTFALGLLFACWRSSVYKFNVVTSGGTDLFEILEVLFLLLGFAGIGLGAEYALEGNPELLCVSGSAVLLVTNTLVIIAAFNSPLRPTKGPWIFNHAIVRSLYQILCATPYALTSLKILPPLQLLRPASLLLCTTDFVTELLYRRVFQGRRQARFLAYNIETWTERHGLIILISIGESGLTLFTTACSIFRTDFSSDILLHFFWLSTCLITTMYSYQIIYFQIDNRIDTENGGCHAVRRSVTTCIVWSFLHFPLVFALIVIAIAHGLRLRLFVNELVKGSVALSDSNPLTHSSFELRGSVEATPQVLRTLSVLLALGEGSVGLLLSCIALCHRGGSRRWRQLARITVRVILSGASAYICHVKARRYDLESQAPHALLLLFAAIAEYAVVEYERQKDRRARVRSEVRAHSDRTLNSNPTDGDPLN